MTIVCPARCPSTPTWLAAETSSSRDRIVRRARVRCRSGRDTADLVREAGLCHKIFVPRLRCGRCAVTHVLLPCFVLAGRLDVAETIGTVLEEVVDGPGGVRPAAARVDVFHSTARSWLRRFL